MTDDEIIEGTIEQSLWAAAPKGILTIRFYCIDSRGMISSIDLKVKKVPDITPGNDENILLIIGIIILGIISAIALIGVIYLLKTNQAIRGDVELMKSQLKTKEFSGELKEKNLKNRK